MTAQIKNVKHGPQVQTFYFLGSNAFAEKLEHQFLGRCGKEKLSNVKFARVDGSSKKTY